LDYGAAVRDSGERFHPDNPLRTIVDAITMRLTAEQLELRAWRHFREAAMRDPSVTLEMCDEAWAALKARAEKAFRETVDA